jgi:hypothetical protein
MAVAAAPGRTAAWSETIAGQDRRPKVDHCQWPMLAETLA